ncbi:MAG TPA: ankyrin repeat domain-containing protein, partial [Chloroflexia bacterium]|nr:ankyrin repeat domain-containing protein [Chloroflexia bacterium]
MDGTQDYFRAIQTGDQAAVSACLAADPTLARARNGQGISAILWAYYNGEPQIAQHLMAQAGSLDVFEAAAAGRTEDVRRLLAAVPDLVNAVSADGFAPLGLAIFFGHPDTARLLLDRGAAVNQISQNRMQVMPLHSAVA